MKRYIRTEDGIYDLETKNNDDEFENQIADIEEISYGGKNGSCVLIPQKRILAEADTPEELCDEYVLPKFRDVFAIDRFSKQVCINHIKCGNGDVYGAIWTSKGLIYVAKMNENGDLELI